MSDDTGSGIDATASDEQMIEPSEGFVGHANVSGNAEYSRLYERSITDSSRFWAEQAREHLTWMRPFTVAASGGFENLDYRFFEEAS